MRPSLPLLVLLLAGCASTTSTAPIPGTSISDAPAIDTSDNTGRTGDVPGRPARLERVIDGDSLELRIDGQVEESRLIGLNTPEGDECLGDAARDRLGELVTDRDLFVETAGRDDFGRLLAVVRTADTYVNLELIREGLAIARDQSGHRDAERFEAAEAEARSAQLGIWQPGACGGPIDVDVDIVAIEANAPGPDQENPNGEWVELRNNSPTPIDMSGWIVRDESTRHRYAFPDDFELAGGAALRLFSGCGPETQSERYWCKIDDSVWNNDGDTAFLLDSSGSTVSSLSY